MDNGNIMINRIRETDSRELSIFDLFKILSRRKGYFFSILFMSIGIAVAVALLTKPVYRAEVVMAPSPQTQQSGGLDASLSQLASIAEGGKQVASPADRAREILLSRAFAFRFIAAENMLPVLAGRGGGELTPWMAWERFDEIRGISSKPTTGVLVLWVEWHDPVLAAKWANSMVTQLNAQMRADAQERAQKAIQYLNEQLESTNLVDMRLVLYRLMEQEARNLMLARVTDEYAFEVVDPAVPPERFVRPKRVVIVVLGGIIGMIMAFLVVLTVDYRRSTVLTG